MDIPTPIIRWADSKSKVFLSIELADVKEQDFEFESGKFVFKGFGIGATGESLYEVSLDLYKEIIAKKCTQKVTDRCISVTLIKDEKESWPRLLKNQQKPGWLKIDFDKMSVEDSEPEEKEPQLSSITLENKMRNDMDRANDEILVFIKIAYLSIYNIGQGVAFWVIVMKLLYRLFIDGQDAFHTAYDDVSDLFLTCQLCAVLEIINPIFKIVNTGVVAPILQVGGRNFILFALVMLHKELHSSAVVYFLFMAWALVETIRYPFYVVSLFRKKFYWLSWLRYSCWVVLYPVGLTCEGLIVFKSIPLVAKSGILSISLPNSMNFAFSFSYFLWIYIILLIFGGSYMMKHLRILRARKLGYRKRQPTKPAYKKD